MTNIFADRYWTSADGLELHYRDYRSEAADGRPPVLCLHGLTRNARDFADLAEHLAPQWRVIVPEMRGRGQSAYADLSHSYGPATYVEDVTALLDELGIDRFVAIGTSLGGLMTMMMAAENADRIAAAVLNDIGPELEEAGLARIREYVGQGRTYATWMHAARALEEAHGSAYPNHSTHEWLDMAKRIMVLGQNGRISYDYDMAIAEPFAADEGAAPPDLWPAYEALAGRPLLILRGALSDLFADRTLARMVERNPDAEAVVVPDVGHAPQLDEPVARAAIDRLLARVS